MSHIVPAVSWSRARVQRSEDEWPGAQWLRCAMEGPKGPGEAEQVRAIAFTALTGRVSVGDEVLLNMTALRRALGTGGHAFVVAVLPDGGPTREPRAMGHLVKARYTPLQAMVLGADEQDSQHHPALADADSIDAMPVITADLHSALPAVIAGIRQVASEMRAPALRIAYVMTDGGALPAAYSRTIAGLREAGWLATCVSVGQAFGGDLEAVSIHSGLLAARIVAKADIAIVAQGPGNLGTGTRWGFSGVSCGEAINAAATLGGRPIGALRVSLADPRERHRGLSHHSVTAYGRVALARAQIAVPELPADYAQLQGDIDAAAEQLRHRHNLVRVPTEPLRGALRTTPVPLRTMGRGLEEDEPCFLASAAAGALAAGAALGREC